MVMEFMGQFYESRSLEDYAYRVAETQRSFSKEPQKEEQTPWLGASKC